MDREELHARIRRLIFASPALSEAFSRGEFRSVFKGRGVDFEALREYDEGEDARLIDWNVTVRLSKPYVRLYREDRSLTLFLLIDLSPSMEMGSAELSKRDAAVLASGLLAYAAQLRGMPVGALLFDGNRFRHFKPKPGKVHALALIEAAVDSNFEGELAGSGMDSTRPGLGAAGHGAAGLGEALEAAARLLKRRSLVIAASDFLGEAWEDPLSRLARRHDLVALRMTDRLDTELPASGGIALRDSEGEERRRFPLASRALRRDWKDAGEERRNECLEACGRARVPLLEMGTEDDPAQLLLGFFGRRRRS